ncbi:14702_t:CDS:2 [Funneliformis geosporum]|uniref:9834_t:CDS:1 n=1 Tax=Funneliformis geosporum TaxID=1117311 RepID=A0A9W4SH59_9GLOM|nr:9834_t:CDS:2 [Funneliformis geosporum]CAI2171009.1 14702_t:CDS:2 [Funneliformis geosporum]
MTIPSKTQDKTEEQEAAAPSNVEDDSLDDSIPPQPITLPNFTNFRNIYINPISFSSTIPPNKDENGEPSPPQPKWDEFCIQWCKQKDLNRDKTIVPECQMLCFRRINAHLKNDLLKKQLVVKEELKHHNKHQAENVAQVLYNKTENGGDKTEFKVPRNFMDGYYLYYIKGLELCQKHTEGMKNDEMFRSGWTQNNPEESEIDLGEKFEQTKSESAKRIIKRAFTPGYQLAKRYVESWKDGTQTSFLKRFYESVQRMDAVHIVQDNIKKAVEDSSNERNEK